MGSEGMNPSRSLFIIGTLFVGSLFTASASRAGEPYLPPRPPKVVDAVRLPPELERGLFRLRLMIDKSGHPRKIAVISLCDEAIKVRLVTAVAKWRFTPATENGQPVEADVILPLHLVDLPDSGRTRF